ncbi:MAG: hypothetical protein ABJH98_00755 [Reichenbachiella sp.]|uniref:hypothetical protein n=1 Tax=Reichenbachiella sp. TaxID=2184521 RepID=UPI0032986FC9
MSRWFEPTHHHQIAKGFLIQRPFFYAQKSTGQHQQSESISKQSYFSSESPVRDSENISQRHQSSRRSNSDGVGVLKPLQKEAILGQFSFL